MFSLGGADSHENLIALSLIIIGGKCSSFYNLRGSGSYFMDGRCLQLGEVK